MKEVLKPTKGKIILSILGVVLYWLFRSWNYILCIAAIPCNELQKYPSIFIVRTSCGCALQPLSGLIFDVISIIIVFIVVYAIYSIIQLLRRSGN